MKMTHCLLLLSFFLPSYLLAQDVTTAGFAEEPITIDGKASEWPVPFRFSDYTSKLMYNIRNDSTTVYFCFRADQPLAQMKLLYYGFDIYIDTTGKKKKTQHLQFPMKNTGEKKGEQTPLGTSQYDLQQRQLRMKSEVNSLLAENFLGLSKGVYPIDSANGIQAAIDFDSLGTLITEIAIPIKRIQANVNCEKIPWSITFRLNAPLASSMNIGTGGETMNRNRDGNGGAGLGTGSVIAPDMDGDLSGTGGTAGLGGGMGGLGANTQAGLYGNGMNGGMAGMGMGGGMNGSMNNNMQLPQQPMGNRSKVFEASEWKFKFKLAK